MRFHIRKRNIYLYYCISNVLIHRTHPYFCILPYLYHVTASLRIRHATQAAKPERTGEPLRAVLFDAERSRDLSASKRMGNFAPRTSARQHVVSPIRVTNKLHGRVQVSEMTRKGFPAYRRGCLPFSQHVVHEVHHVASSNRATVVNELPASVPLGRRVRLQFSYSLTLFFQSLRSTFHDFTFE